MAIEIVDFPMKNGGYFHSYVSHYQRVFSSGQRPGDDTQNIQIIIPVTENDGFGHDQIYPDLYVFHCY